MMAVTRSVREPCLPAKHDTPAAARQHPTASVPARKPPQGQRLNNYLGLANHPEVREADARGAAEFGLAAPMGARMMSGQTKYHEQLESELAAFVRCV